MIRNYLFLIFLFTCYSASSQEIILKGKITTKDLEGSSINIVNLSKELGTTNNPQGEFEIPVSLNDTLLFSSVQYEIQEIVITEEVLKKAFLAVLLVEKLNELEEVSISNTQLSGNIATDIQNIPTLTQADLGFPMSDVPRPTSVERKLMTASSGLDLLFNTLNGKIKMLKKAAVWEDHEQLVEAGISAVSREFFVDELFIPEDHIKNFVYFCAEKPDFKNLIMKKQELEIIEFYIAMAPEFFAFVSEEPSEE